VLVSAGLALWLAGAIFLLFVGLWLCFMAIKLIVFLVFPRRD
jgi:hypothetical protein